jgi:hypothetical protein
LPALHFRSCYPLFSLSSFYSSEVKVYVGPDLPPSVDDLAMSSPTSAGPSLSPSPPLAVIQQVVMKAMVHPYRKDALVVTDAFRKESIPSLPFPMA